MANSPVFKKLNLRDHRRICVLNAPKSFEPEVGSLEGVEVQRDLSRGLPFVLAFVTRQNEVDRLAKEISENTEGDAVVWFAYPKGTSKRYRSEMSRDSGWDALAAAGFEGCRMVAIDEDWSAKRYRRREFIKRGK